MRVLVVAHNSSMWKTWDEKLKQLRDWFAPKADIHFDLKHVVLKDIQWSRYYSTDPAQQGENWLGVDPVYYDKYITPLAIGYDAVLLVIPSKEWKEPNKARGWRSDNDQGVIQLQIGAGEKEKMTWPGFPRMSVFFQLARHELCHACFVLTRQYDMTHYFWDRGEIEKARDTLSFPADWQLPGLQKTVLYLQNILNKLLAQSSTVPSVKESDAIIETPNEPTMPTFLDNFCIAMKKHEGWHEPGEPGYPRGSRSYRNNNPGNTRFSRAGYLPKYGTVKEDRSGVDEHQAGFAIFPTYALGYLYMQNLILQKIKKHPEWSFYQFFGDEKEGWAPASDGNNSKLYAEIVANRCGVPATTKLGTLL